MKTLKIGDTVVKIPIIQGGMGVGISRSRLAGAVAKEGAIGIISTAQIGYDEDDFENNQDECNLMAIKKHIKKAKEIADGNGLVGVNIMTALKHFKNHVKASVMAGADVIICGAGLPIELPGIVRDAVNEAKEEDNYDISKDDIKSIDNKTCKQQPVNKNIYKHIPYIAPIVSSERALNIILKQWSKKYDTTADFIVVEGPLAGGQLKDITSIDYDNELKNIISAKKVYEEKYKKHIPVIAAGGIFDKKDIMHMTELGADGVQIASRFVATYECDADDNYKKAYINAKKEDITIIQSPVGMPGRAINNNFVKRIQMQNEKITKCYNCLEKCNPAKVPYCITKALTKAVQGNVEDGLIFCGANVDRITDIISVHDLIRQLC
mgnify:CR=1 FL=1